MVDPSASTPMTPFDWLHGGLFFGGSKISTHEEDRIDTCDDMVSLLNGISGDLTSINASIAATQSSGSISLDDSNQSTSPSEIIASRLSRIRFLLYDERKTTSHENKHSQNSPTVAENTLQVLIGETHRDLIPRLLESFSILPFESRKHVAVIFNYLLVCGSEGDDAALYMTTMEQFCDYVANNFECIMTIIVDGHDLSRHGSPDVGLHFGTMYRSCCRHPTLYKQLVGTHERAERFVFPFLDVYVHYPNFELSSDAMESVRAAFAANGDRVAQMDDMAAATSAELAATFLSRDYTDIWDDRFNPKLLSESANYMTRRVALQILSTVLLTRSNYATMIRYISSRANLIVVMQLLRDTSPHITLDAFHVFKVFVANPNKPPEIIKILQDNKVKLSAYLQTLHIEKEDSDTQFRDEKALIIATIDGL